MERFDVCDRLGRVVAWAVEVGPVRAVVPAAGLDVSPLVDDGDRDPWDALPDALADPELQRPVRGRWDALWLRRAGFLNAAELVLFPGQPYETLTPAERHLCEAFARSWALELDPKRWVDNRQGVLPAYGEDPAPRPMHLTPVRLRPARDRDDADDDAAEDFELAA